MKSTGDPILDLQAACAEKPLMADELQAVYKKLGWAIPYEAVLSMAEGTYIIKGPDGLYRDRAGKVEDVITKALRSPV